MANFHVTGSNDMTALDLSDFSGGTVTQNTSSEVVVKGASGTTYELFGDFSGGTGSTLPTGGTITTFKEINDTDGTSNVIVGNLSLSVADFNTFVADDNGTGLQDEMFKGADQFNLASGNGNNNVFGAAGNDLFLVGGSLAAGDTINGNGGFNTVVFNGDYSDGLTLGATTLENIQRLDFTGHNAYNITTADATVATGETLDVDARNVGPDGSLTFDGSAETDGRFIFQLAGTNPSNITGGAGDDVFHGGGTNSTLNGGAGNDTFYFGGNFDGTDTINGGSGDNVLHLDGDYSAGLAFTATDLQNIQKLVLEHGNDYHVSLDAANDTNGNTMTIDGRDLHAADSLTFDGTAVAGNLAIDGGAGADVLQGGTGTLNVFNGGAGADRMTAGGGTDHFVYESAADSTGTHYDAISGFNADSDKVVLYNETVTAINTAVTTGALSTATFNTDLAHDLGASHLGIHHAVLFTADSGDLSGDTFLVIDVNGEAGYQGKGDIVIQLSGATNLSDLSTANFGDHSLTLT
ncbi:MAG TPA: calcium-binding protein [Rhizomicrobium sp.]|jgi:Ca2+-binding RTX toxin-like protein